MTIPFFDRLVRLSEASLKGNRLLCLDVRTIRRYASYRFASKVRIGSSSSSQARRGPSCFTRSATKHQQSKQGFFSGSFLFSAYLPFCRVHSKVITMVKGPHLNQSEPSASGGVRLTPRKGKRESFPISPITYVDSAPHQLPFILLNLQQCAIRFSILLQGPPIVITSRRITRHQTARPQE